MVIVVMDPRSPRVQTAPSTPANGALTARQLPGVSSVQRGSGRVPHPRSGRGARPGRGPRTGRAEAARGPRRAPDRRGRGRLDRLPRRCALGRAAAEDRGHLPAELRLAAAEGCSGPRSWSRSRPATSSGSSPGQLDLDRFTQLVEEARGRRSRGALGHASQGARALARRAVRRLHLRVVRAARDRPAERATAVGARGADRRGPRGRPPRRARRRAGAARRRVSAARAAARRS